MSNLEKNLKEKLNNIFNNSKYRIKLTFNLMAQIHFKNTI